MKNTAKLEKKGEILSVTFKEKPTSEIQKGLSGRGFISVANYKKWLKKTTAKIPLFNGLGDLAAPYVPADKVCNILDTIVPDSMEYETGIAIRKVQNKVGSITEYVRKKLHYTKEELCKSLASEQVDAVGLAIYNIEERSQAMIIGDQTGIGKGRVAASMVRYGHYAGKQPIFISEKPNLFSDLYRDMNDIGSSKLKPFIINSNSSKTAVKFKGEIIYKPLSPSEQATIFRTGKVPKEYDYVMATYSQFNSPETKPTKPDFLYNIARDNIVILDESHNASGSSNTGAFFMSVLRETQGVVFLSATFAKRPDNMPLYATKTALSDTNMNQIELVDAIINGGVALQEIIASQLVGEGQMLRRERSFDNVEINWLTLNDDALLHKTISDRVTGLMQKIIDFQNKYVDELVAALDKILKAEFKEAELRKGTKDLGIGNQPVFSKVFNLVNQLLFSIKAESVADIAINHLRNGKKPVIAFASTMESFLSDMENERGLPVGNGDIVKSDFSMVLLKALKGTLRYTEKDEVYNEDKNVFETKSIYKSFDLSELPPEAQVTFREIEEKINEVSIGISISPIDIVIEKIEKAGFSVVEVTGRKTRLAHKPNNKALVMKRKRTPTNDAFEAFNNNEVDVLLINQSGSTGASAHAIVTDKVPADQVKQRVMVILQAELNINTEVQKRGRINRTGQILPPIYDYVTSVVPAEQRLMMMLKKKLKSLDANTTSSQSQSEGTIESIDFLNKYGDKMIVEYLIERPELYKKIGEPLGEDLKTTSDTANAAHKVSGRIAILSIKDQTEFYEEMSQMYTKYVEYLKQAGQYDLEVEDVNLQADPISRDVVVVGRGGESEFGTDTYLEKAWVNNLRKPYTKVELETLIEESLAGGDAKEIAAAIIEEYKSFMLIRLAQEEKEYTESYEEKIRQITSEPRYKKTAPEHREVYVQNRRKELNAAMEEAIKKNKEKQNNIYKYVYKYFDGFKIGHTYKYPLENRSDTAYAVFLGFVINKKNKNPYAPSSLGARFAVANSIKYITLALSGEQGSKLDSIIAASSYVYANDYQTYWDEEAKKNSSDRIVRHIITGNILQGAAKYKGKLISYTLLAGGTAKGILLPSAWTPDDAKTSNTTANLINVPIVKAVKVIKSLTFGSSLSDAAGAFTIGKDYYDDFVITTKSSSKYKYVFADEDLLKLVESANGFEKKGNKMHATIPKDKFDKLIMLLDRKFSVSLGISKVMYGLYVEDTEEKDNVSVDKDKEKYLKEYEADKSKFEARKNKQKDKKEEQKKEKKETIIRKMNTLLPELEQLYYSEKGVAGITHPNIKTF